MIFIRFIEPRAEDWQQWRAECDAEQQALNQSHQAGNPIKIKGRIYKGEKQSIKRKYYSNPKGQFWGKCIFCEQKIYADQHVDIEHFRPKGAIFGLDGKQIKLTINGHEQNHPGYYWLAYEWRNLLPSCTLCNRSGTDPVSYRPTGKRNYFPVKDFRATRPGEETREEPLLINPMFEDPSNHIDIYESGQLKQLSPEGDMSIKLLGLNDRDLPIFRKEMYDSVLDKLRLYVMDLAEQPNEEKFRKLANTMKEIRDGRVKFSIAARKALDYYVTKERRDTFAKLAELFS
ncbi:MAG: hypothetical protein ACETWG_09185 [Candidatus Neomarinimicrobiota bacterium]